jgi:hypothetical protein
VGPWLPVDAGQFATLHRGDAAVRRWELSPPAGG